MITSKSKYKFVRAWDCPIPIKEFIKKKFKGKVLNLCCGTWPCGDVNIDLHTKGMNIQGTKIINADVLSEEFNLKERFDTVFCDPPWNWPYHWRAHLHKSAARHLKRGGQFILNAPWPPRAFYFEIKEIYVMFKEAGLPANAALLSIAEYKGKVEGENVD